MVDIEKQIAWAKERGYEAYDLYGQTVFACYDSSDSLLTRVNMFFKKIGTEWPEGKSIHCSIPGFIVIGFDRDTDDSGFRVQLINLIFKDEEKVRAVAS